METKQSKYQRHTHKSFTTTHAELRITEIKHTLRACLHGSGGPQVDEVTCLGGVKKYPSFTCNLTTPPPRGAHFQDY